MAPTYKVLAQDINSRELIAELPWTSISITEARNSVGSGSLTLPMRDRITGGIVSSDLFGVGRSAFIVLRGDIPVGKFFMSGMNMSYPGEITVRGFASLGYMGRRHIRKALTYTSIDHFQIVRNLVDDMQASSVGDIGITVTQGNAGVIRSRSYPAQEQIAYLTALQELAEATPGFSWFESTGNESTGYETKLNLTSTATEVSDVVFDLEKNLRSLSVNISSSNMANTATMWSKSREGTSQISRSRTNANALGIYPQYDIGRQTAFAIEEAELIAAHAQSYVDAYSGEVRSFTFDVEQDLDSDYSRYRLGSIVKLTARYGYLNHAATNVLVNSRELAVDGGGRETVRVGATLL